MITTSSTTLLKTLLLLFLLIGGLVFAKTFLIPLSIGAVLATVFFPLCKWFERKISRAWASLCCVLLFLLLIAGVISLVGWQVSDLAEDVELIKQKSLQFLNSAQQFIFQKVGVSKEKQLQMIKNQSQTIGPLVKQIAAGLPNLFTNSILVLVYLFLLLYFRGHIKQFILKLSGTSERKETEKVIYNVAHVSEEYLVGLAKMIFCLWIMYGIGFSALGLKHALFFAFLCGLLEIIPFIGNITGTGITLLVAAVQGASPPTLLGIAGVYVLAQIIQGSLIQPLILGSEVKINPLFTIIALVTGGLIWGLSGVFLAIPLMAMLKIVCDHIEPLKPYGFLIGEIGSGDKGPAFTKKFLNWVKKKWKAKNKN